jgi:cyanate lyase
MRFIQVTTFEQEILKEGYKNHPSHPVRRRFYGILLSSYGKPVKEIASIKFVSERFMIGWIDRKLLVL